MKAQRVYIVLGGCFDPEFARWSNALIEDFRTGKLVPVISEIITAEIADAPTEVRELLVDKIRLGSFSFQVGNLPASSKKRHAAAGCSVQLPCHHDDDDLRSLFGPGTAAPQCGSCSYGSTAPHRFPRQCNLHQRDPP
ncbi:MAG: hypothetical protein NTV33_09415 [Coprothermobacterota bacterium]|nr:hypothetical protein [Coprothermobacterota bacterium]